ncbi:autotransporter outer membrane beta-barrel domain-containing protein [Thorsellia kenyensis]|uniref:Autotransporter outer membrane beta-barrel domain-containing protein n=1 Tax=Thorsellia kenyensis TaxID=1549888 RepID=A0ABV6CDS7_9GAMM
MKRTKIATLINNHFSSTSLNTNTYRRPSLNMTKSLGYAILSLGILGISNSEVLAVTTDSCSIEMNCTIVKNTADLNAVLNNTSSKITRLVLANDIKLTSDVFVKMVESNRKNIVIDGNGFSLDAATFDFNFATRTPAEWNEQKGSFTFENFKKLVSSEAALEAVVRVDKDAAIDIEFNKIDEFSNSMYAIMGVAGASALGNPKAEVIFGDINKQLNFTYDVNHQIVQGGPLRFKGKFDIFTDGAQGAYNTVFWSNVANDYNIMTFESTADLSAKVTKFTLGATNNNGAYKYVMHDGAKFKLHTSTNTFGSSNNGLELGSYDDVTGFNKGVVLDLANYNGEALIGDSISNLGGDNSGGLGNGSKTSGDVVLNIGTGSKLAYTGANSAGIKVIKNNNIDGNVYIRSDAALNATNANGIVTTMNGTGDLVLLNDINGNINAQNGILFSTKSGQGSYEITNKGTINSSINGISLTADTQNATDLSLNLTDSNINVNSGIGVLVSGNLNSKISGGNITLDSNGTAGLSILNKGITDIKNLILTLNNKVESGIISDNNSIITLRESTINAKNQSTGLNRLRKLTLDDLVINASEKATGILVTADDLASWTIEKLTLNVSDEANGLTLNGGWDFDKTITINMSENALGYALKYLDSANTSELTINDNFQFNGTGKNALLISGINDKVVNQTGEIIGNVEINNQGNTTYNLTGSLTGNIKSQTANTSLNFYDDAIYFGDITLLQGPNNITLGGKSNVTGQYIGNDAIDILTLKDNTTSNLSFDLANGDNIVNIIDSALINDIITTGSGNDVFNLTNLTTSSVNKQLNAGAGANILNLSMKNGLDGETFNLSLDNLWLDFQIANIINSNLSLNDLGAATGTLFNLNSAHLTIANQNNSSSDFNNTIEGTGNISLNGKINLVNNNKNFNGNWVINNSGELNTSLEGGFGSGTITNNGLLSLNGVNTLNNALSGMGTLSINNADYFNFNNTLVNTFSGNIALNNSTIKLDENNTSALSNANLILNEGGVVNIDKDTTIGDLSIAGGNLNFSLNGPTDSPLLTVKNLDVDSLNNSTLNIAGLINLNRPTQSTVETSTNFLDSDSSLSGKAIQLISATSINNGDKQLQLSIDGNDGLKGIQFTNVSDGFGNLVDTIYDYVALSSIDGANGPGIYVDVLLKELISKTNVVFNNQNSNSNSVNALLSGIGGIEIQAKDNQAISINNEKNSYSGKTVVTSGTLQLGANNALGNTSELSITDNAKVDMLNSTLTLLNLTGGGQFDINNGELNLTSANFNGTFTGNDKGALTVSDYVVLAGDNKFTGKTTIEGNGTLQIGNGEASASYSGNVLNNGKLLFNNNSEAIYNAIITGTGSLTKEGLGNLVIENAQSYTGDTLINSGSMTLIKNADLTSNIINNSKLIFAKDSDYEFSKLISGTGNVVVNSTGKTTLLGDNSYTGGTDLQKGQLVLKSATAAGTGTISVNSDLSLDFVNSSFKNAIVGNGNVNINGKNITLENILPFKGQMNVHTNASLNLASSLGNAKYNIEGTLNFKNNIDTTINNTLKGNGLINIDTEGNKFSFSQNQDSDGFEGTLALTNAIFDLDDENNRKGIAKGTLSLGTGSVANIGSDHEINNLDIFGGELSISMQNPTTPHVLSVTNLSVDNSMNSGKVNLIGAKLAEPNATDVQKNLLEQNRLDPSTGFLVVKSETVSTPGQILKLTVDGESRENIKKPIYDSHKNKINATYDYIGIAADKTINESLKQNGLYVTYLLTQVESIDKLIIDAVGSSYNQFLARITGEGSVELRASDKPLIISNSQNDNTGGSILRNGSIQLGADNSISQFGSITVIDAVFDLNGKTQNITSIDLNDTSRLDINNGVLNFNGSNDKVSAINGTLAGAGTFNINSGEFTFNRENNTLTAAVNLAKDAMVVLNEKANLGSGQLNLSNGATLELNSATSLVKNALSGEGNVNLVSSKATLDGISEKFAGIFNIDSNSELTLNNLKNIGQASINNNGSLSINLTGLDQELSQNISGTGLINKLGDGILRIAKDFSKLETFSVNAGTLILSGNDAMIKALDIRDNAFAGGAGSILGDVTNEGILLVGNAADISDDMQVLEINGNLNNFNIVSLAGSKVGNNLIVKGNYDARSDLIFNTVLAGDDSITDKLSINGNTSGHTTVYVQNAGGKGAQTQKGIELITINGNSAGTFALGNRVVAGSYDYQLVQQDTNWVLQSNLMAIRPEIGAYLANVDMAIATINNSYSDRINQIKQDPNSPVWGKIVGSVTDSRAANTISQRLYSSYVEIGSDLFEIDNSNSRFTSGLFGAIGSGHSSNTSDVTDFVANTSQDNYRIGTYGTYLTNAFSLHNPAYIDSSLQYSWASNKVAGQDVSDAQTYDANAFAVSLEGGLPLTVYSEDNQYVDVIPQTQITYKRHRADDILESNGTLITHPTVDGLVTRLGTEIRYNTLTESQLQLTGYTGINWIHDDVKAAINFDDKRYFSDKPSDIFDLKLGININMPSNLSTFAEVNTQQGKNDYSNVKGTIGLRYEF